MLEKMTNNQRGLVASYVQRSADFELSQNCSDLAENDFNGWTDEEKKSFCDMINIWNCEDGERFFESVNEIQSWMLVSFGAWLLSPEPEEENNNEV